MSGISRLRLPRLVPAALVIAAAALLATPVPTAALPPAPALVVAGAVNVAPTCGACWD